jgi:hypothetical protein
MHAQTLVYDLGQFDLKPNQTFPYFWDVPDNPGNAAATWTVTAVPGYTIEGPARPEQRVEVIDFFLLRKGPDAAPPGPNHLQLNFKLKNLTKNPAKGNLVASVVVERP